MEVGGPYRVRQSMSSHVEHRSYDFADHSMLCLSSPALVEIKQNVITFQDLKFVFYFSSHVKALVAR